MDGDSGSLSASGHEVRTCQACKTDFNIEPEDFDFYKKIAVPPPTWCPACRFQRRALFRNECKLFRGVSGFSGKNFFTLFPPESGYTVYLDEEWRSDAWDPSTYGMEIDFSKPFLAQFKELALVVPKSGTEAISMVNSEYSANAGWLKNCYLMFNSNSTEDCTYGNGVDFCRNCVDNSHLQKCEGCYDSFWLFNCYRTFGSSQCEDCNNVWFSRDCRGCSDCVGCANLRLKKYCIFNVQYSKEEYEKKVAEMRLDTWSGFRRAKELAEDLWKNHPSKYMEGVQNSNVSGEYITNSKNVRESYLVRECQDLKYVQYSQMPSSKDSMDCTLAGNNSQAMYEASVCGWGGSDIKFCWDCWNEVRAIEYCAFCQVSSNLFGCVGMKNKKYCILNKQYSKEEYEELVPKIKKHMDDMPYVDGQGRVYKYGEFLPPEFSPFAYAQTIAEEHFPLTKDQVEAFGARWQDSNPTEYQTTLAAADIPDAISDVKDDIAKEIIQCAECKRAYRVISQELQFLRQMNIPAPRVCVDCRRTARLSHRNKSFVYPRACGCAGSVSTNGMYSNTATHFHQSGACTNEFQTSYAPDRPEIVYCEQCYNSEVS
jgi:hypothetical protein